MAMEEKLKDYMENAGKNDAISVFDQGRYTLNSEEDLEEKLKEMNNDMLYDWSSMGFDFINEGEMLEEEIGQNLDDDEIHKIAASAFEKYYIPAFLDEIKTHRGPIIKHVIIHFLQSFFKLFFAIQCVSPLIEN